MKLTNACLAEVNNLLNNKRLTYIDMLKLTNLKYSILTFKHFTTPLAL